MFGINFITSIKTTFQSSKKSATENEKENTAAMAADLLFPKITEAKTTNNISDPKNIRDYQPMKKT